MSIHRAAPFFGQVLDHRKMLRQSLHVAVADSGNYALPVLIDDAVCNMGNVDGVDFTDQHPAYEECNAAKRKQTSGIQTGKMSKCGHVTVWNRPRRR